MKIQDLKKYKTLDITQLSGSPWNSAEKVLGLDENDRVLMAEPDAVTYEYVDSAITEAMEAETARTEATYLKEHQSLDDYYTKEQVDDLIENVEVDLDDYYTKEQIDDIVEHIDVSDQLQNYALTTAVTQDIQTAIASETARTEDVYAKKTDLPDMGNYYTKAQTDAEITGATEDMATKTWVGQQGYVTDHDLGGYAKTTAVTEDIQTAIASETARTEDVYAKKTDVPSLDGYWTSAQTENAITAATATTTGWVASQGYLTEHQSLAGLFDDASYVSSSKTINFYDKGDNLVGQIDATDFIKDGMVDNVYISGSTLIISFNTDAGQEDITINLTDIFNPANYYDKTAVDGIIAAETGRTENTYIKQSALPISVSSISTGWRGYDDRVIQEIKFLRTRTSDGATLQSQDIYPRRLNGEDIISVNREGATEITLPTFNDVSTAITQAIETETGRTESTYAKIADIPSLTGYATEDYVDASVTAATATTTGWVESQGYLTQHQDLSNYALTTAVTQDISTAIASETARTEETYAKISQIPSLDGYWTSAQTQSAITAATDDMATKTWVGEQGYLTQHQDISGKLDVSTFETYTGATDTILEGKADISDIPDVSGFVTSGDVETQIGTAMATETARTESTYLKEHQDISGKLDKTDFNTYTGATETALNGKVDLTTYTAYTGSTATAIAAKQDTLVSGTNIKTINNQSLLGEGNITIQGGGGGGETVVELTKAQYDALDPPATDTTYIITDAETVDLNDYAMASGLTELSGTVATINSNYATKQNVTARASNSNYLPGWNAQGVITGSTAYYSKSQGINGTNYNVFSNSNTNHPAIFAPTSAGTAGQPLLSNGSGAPVWGGYKFAFITQTQYDALSTKDATTIYFITGD